MRYQLQEVFKFACGLNAEVFLDFIYMNLKEFILQQTHIPEYMFDYEASFLKSLMKEIPENKKFDPLHNKYINFVKENDTKIFVPSKVYIFGPSIKSQEVELSEEELTLEPFTAECLMKLEDEDVSDILKILQTIGTNQEISICHLDLKKVTCPHEVNILHLACETLKISTNITCISTNACRIPQLVYENLVKQLQNCDKLQRLDLGDSEFMDLGKAIATSKSLRELYLYDCKIQDEVYDEIVYHLRRHTGLEKLRLYNTEGVPKELGDVFAEINSLKQFTAEECNMDETTAESVSSGLAKCHELQELRLKGNNLTNCLEKLFPSTRGFSHLTLLFINRTELSQKDLLVLSRAVRCGKLPKLMTLDLCYNNMTGRLRSLLCGTGHPGFPLLRYLGLKKAELNRDDMMSLSEAVNQNLMPQLRYLCLDKNDLSSMESKGKDLVEMCTKRYGKLDLAVQLSKTNLPEAFITEMNDICSGTVVWIKVTS